MHRSGFNSDRIQENEILDLKNVTSLTIENNGDTEMYVSINDVVSVVPKFDTTHQFASQFDIPGDGTRTDLKIKIDFETGRGKANIRYRVFIPEKNC